MRLVSTSRVATAGFRPASAPRRNSPSVMTHVATPTKNGKGTEPELDDKSKEYTETMNARMGSALVYRHEDGINWNYILDDLIVGSCPQKPDDIDLLREKEKVDVVFSLQEDCDMEYFNIEVTGITGRAKSRGDIKIVRNPVRDFDPFNLRQRLPRAVSKLAKAKGEDKKAYIHCTAGMGRAPATALAYMYWVLGLNLEESFDKLTTLRRCNPKLEAIRAATLDVLLGAPKVPVIIASTRIGEATKVQIAGLDVGWGSRVDLTREKDGRWVLRRDIPMGTYQYKWIIDDIWTYSADHPTVLDGGNINNTVAVFGNVPGMDIEMASRILAPGCGMNAREKAMIKEIILSGRFLEGVEEEDRLIEAASQAAFAARQLAKKEAEEAVAAAAAAGPAAAAATPAAEVSA